VNILDGVTNQYKGLQYDISLNISRIIVELWDDKALKSPWFNNLADFPKNYIENKMCVSVFFTTCY
jgi:hypothetical protein